MKPERRFKHNGYTVEIHFDQDADAPEQEVACFLITKPNRYFQPDLPPDVRVDLDSPESIENSIGETHHLYPLFAYIHGGVSLSMSKTGQFADQWDGGQIGFVAITKDSSDIPEPEKYAEGHIETWNMYPSNDVSCGACMASTTASAKLRMPCRTCSPSRSSAQLIMAAIAALESRRIHTMPKAIRGLDAADNGNDFLCLTCSNSQHRSGRMSEMQVICTTVRAGDNNRLIPFRVTQCSEYESKDIAKEYDDLPKDTRKVAFYLDRRTTIRGEKNKNYMKFIDYSIAQETDLIY